MKTTAKILTCLLLVLTVVSLAQAQASKTVKGYVCSSEHSQNETGGSIRLLVGEEILTIWYTLSLSPGEMEGKTKRQLQRYEREHTTNLFPASKSISYFERIGTELIIKYKADGEWAISLTSTGKRKKIKSCSTE